MKKEKIKKKQTNAKLLSLCTSAEPGIPTPLEQQKPSGTSFLLLLFFDIRFLTIILHLFHIRICSFDNCVVTLTPKSYE